MKMTNNYNKIDVKLYEVEIIHLHFIYNIII